MIYIVVDRVFKGLFVYEGMLQGSPKLQEHVNLALDIRIYFFRLRCVDKMGGHNDQ